MMSEISLPPVRVLPGGRVESYGHTLRTLIATAWDLNTLYQKIGAYLAPNDAPPST